MVQNRDGAALKDRVLFRDADLLVRLRARHGSRVLVVTFSPLKTTPSLERAGFGEGFLDRYGIDAVHVTCAANRWYQYASFPDAIRAIAEVAEGYDEVVTYGSSMGGYQALRSAAELGAARAIAISPQYSVDPAKVPLETRWASDVVNIRFVDDGYTVSDKTAYYVVYDPWEKLDRMHVDAIRTVLPIQELRLPFSGHPSGEFLREAGIISRLMLQLIRGDAPPAGLRSIVRAARANSVTYLLNVQRDRRWPSKWREHWLSRAREMAPGDASVMITTAVAHLSDRRLDEAHETAAAAVALAPNKTAYRLVLASALARLGRADEADAEARKVLEVDPYNAKARRLSHTFQLTAIVLSPHSGLAGLIRRSLRRASVQVRTARYLDGSADRPQPRNPAEEEAEAAKRASEALIRAALLDGKEPHGLLTAWRTPPQQLMWAIWSAKRRALVGQLDGQGDFDRKTLEQVQRWIARLMEQEAAYGARVYTPLGLPSEPTPGRYTTLRGAPAYVLDAEALEESFTEATEELYGRSIPLAAAELDEGASGLAFQRFRSFWQAHEAEIGSGQASEPRDG